MFVFVCLFVFSRIYRKVGHSDKKNIFIFYAFPIKRPIFFFGKMPGENNCDDEPAF